MASHKTILLTKYTSKRVQRNANTGTILPGHLVELMSTDKFKLHATAGGEVVPKIVVVEDDIQGNDITDYYTSGDPIQAEVVDAGDVVLLRLKNGENVAIGDKLESAGDGTVQKWVKDSGSVTEVSEQIVAIALEAMDMSGSSGVDPNGILKSMIV